MMNCDLYQNPYRTRCSGSISPDDGVSVCWRHLAASRDEWMARAKKAEHTVNVIVQASLDRDLKDPEYVAKIQESRRQMKALLPKIDLMHETGKPFAPIRDPRT